MLAMLEAKPCHAMPCSDLTCWCVLLASLRLLVLPSRFEDLFPPLHIPIPNLVLSDLQVRLFLRHPRPHAHPRLGTWNTRNLLLLTLRSLLSALASATPTATYNCRSDHLLTDSLRDDDSTAIRSRFAFSPRGPNLDAAWMPAAVIDQVTRTWISEPTPAPSATPASSQKRPRLC